MFAESWDETTKSAGNEMSKVTPAKSKDSTASRADSPPSSIAEVSTQEDSRSVKWRVQSQWQQKISGPGSPDWFHLNTSYTARIVKQGQGRVVWRVKLGNESVYAKVAAPTRWFDRIKIMLAGSIAMREWRSLLAADSQGVPVVNAIAVGEELAPAKRSVLVTSEFDGAVDLRLFWLELRRRNSEQPSTTDKRDLVTGLAGFIAASHQRGFMHRDLHPANILVLNNPGEGFIFRFVDLLGCCLGRGEIGRSAAIRSLSQLHQFFGRQSTRASRLRFLRAYLLHLGEVAEGEPARRLRRSWVGLILAQTDNIAMSLSRQRDRRLCRNGKYFSQWRGGDSWRGVISLQLERRHIFPEPNIEDRSKQDWTEMLSEMLPKLSGSGDGGGSLVSGGLRWEHRRATGLPERFKWSWLGSPAKQAFIENHRKRHRSQDAPLILAYFHHVRSGTVDLCVSVHPAEQ